MYTEQKRIFSLVFDAANIQLDSLWTHLKDMSLSFSHPQQEP